MVMTFLLFKILNKKPSKVCELYMKKKSPTKIVCPPKKCCSGLLPALPLLKYATAKCLDIQIYIGDEFRI